MNVLLPLNILLVITLFLTAPSPSWSAQKDQDSSRPMGNLQGIASRVGQWSKGAGSLAANASIAALVTTANTLSLIAGAAEYSGKTLWNFGQPLWRAATGPGDQTKAPEKQPNGRAKPPAGYSPGESTLRCPECGQQTVIRGDLPGLVITCPACGKVIKE